jgi:transcriptional regulator with XRE-family HTH domain
MKNKLREVRTKKGISQLELSRLTKIAPANICNIENGKQYPYPGWRRRIVEVLDMPEEAVFPEFHQGKGEAEK